MSWFEGQTAERQGTCSIGCCFPFNTAQGSPHLDDPQVGAQLTVQPELIPADTAVDVAADSAVDSVVDSAVDSAVDEQL